VLQGERPGNISLSLYPQTLGIDRILLGYIPLIVIIALSSVTSVLQILTMNRSHRKKSHMKAL